ncbi:MAG TPA: hypothetical protein VIH86_16510 [Puia sp.]
MATIDYANARKILDDIYMPVNDATYVPSTTISQAVIDHINTLFKSDTQSFREVLLGCALVRQMDKTANLRKPYINLGAGAYNGRTLDEKVINKFLHHQEVPSSKGPYLATFRRSVEFDDSIAKGMRDKNSFASFMACIQYLESLNNDSEITDFISALLVKFIELRSSSKVTVARIRRFAAHFQ